jgi:hypothetical protein
MKNHRPFHMKNLRELSAADARPSAVKNMKRLIGTAAAVLLMAGCGTEAATQTTIKTAAAAPTGCAAVSLATSVTVQREAELREPVHGAALVDQHNVTATRALLRDFCAVIAHRTKGMIAISCPLDTGLTYNGTFYAGDRPIAKFVFAATGCQTVTLTAAGKTTTQLVYGSALAAAPHLDSHLSAVLR